MFMMLVLGLFVVSVIIELLLPWVTRKNNLAIGLLTAIGITSLLAATVLLLILTINVGTLLIATITGYRLVSFASIYIGRMHPAYLRSVSPRTTSCLAGAQVELWLLVVIWRHLDPSLSTILLLITAVQLIVAVVMYRSMQQHVSHSRQQVETKALISSQLPAITIAVAARNETEELMACLESLIASDYPKLEILVLDDCSQNRRTSEIIRSFAHRGVRFIPGGEPNSSWLARNHAYNTLARAASGSYLLYCSTSIRLAPDSLQKMVRYMKTHDKNMLSIMPGYRRKPGQYIDLEAMRAAWELLPPRRYVGHPPVFNSCWMVRTSALKKLGGFAAVSRMIIPETYFASYFASEDSYSFLPGGDYFGVISDKEAAEQTKTAIRTYYPSLHRRPENVLFFSIVVAVICLLPLPLALAVLFGWEFSLVSLLAVLTSAVLLTTYDKLRRLMYGASNLYDAVSFAPAVCMQLTLLQYSMYKYEFSEVVWKDRNVCIPVMHVIPHLPKT